MLPALRAKQITGIDFFDRDPREVARELLGKILVRELEDRKYVTGRIVEVEAYLPKGDLGAHNTRGHTKATSSLFKGPGTIYVHSARQHFCVDIVAESSGSVLIRALEPIEGIEFMKKERRLEDIFLLTTGPGRLCKALKIDKTLGGGNVLAKDSRLFVASDNYVPEKIETAKRIGISKAVKEIEQRYYIGASLYLSR